MKNIDLEVVRYRMQRIQPAANPPAGFRKTTDAYNLIECERHRCRGWRLSGHGIFALDESNKNCSIKLMPRRPKDPADIFSHSDLAIASCLTKRLAQLMADNGLLPGDRGIRDFKRICVIGAFVSAGAPISIAGRLIEKLLWSFNQVDGEMPSGLSHMALELAGEHRSPRSLPPNGEPNDYWYHRDLYCRPSLYRAGEAYRSDAYVEIADREHVYLTSKTGVRLLDALDPSMPETSYEGWIEGWGRGTEPSFHSCAELSEADRERSKALAIFARKNAVGLLTINASLAIRNGLDRLADFRARKTAQS